MIRDSTIPELPFIELGQTANIFERFNRCISSRSMMAVFGYYATGKSRLFKQFALHAEKAIDTDQILIIRVGRIPRSQKARDRITPVTRVVFSQLLRALRIVARRPLSDWRKMLDAEPTRVTYDGNQFDDLYDKVLLGIERTNIRAIIIDDIVTSQDLDIFLFEELLRLWRESHGRFSIILGIQMEDKANFYKEVGYLRGAMGAVRHLCTDYVEVERLPPPEKVLEDEEWEFEGRVIPALLIHLDARPTQEFQDRQQEFVDKIWIYTKGNWMALTTTAKLFDEELGTDDRRGRVLSWTVAERVFARLSYLGKLW